MSQDYRLVVPQDLYLEMLEQASSELPNECCGLLAGMVVEVPGQPPVGRVLARYPLVNKLVSPVEFFSDERSMLAAHRDMQRRSIDLLAIYHSHPISDPIPSRKDREQSYYGPGIMNLIISLKDEQPRMAGWWLTPEEYRSAEWALEE